MQLMKNLTCLKKRVILVPEQRVVELSENDIDIKVSGRKDKFKNKENKKELQQLAYNYILNGNINYNIIDIIDKVSAKEYIFGRNSKKLSPKEYMQKMRIAPMIEELIKNASIKYYSPISHESSLFKNGFNNYQGNF